MARLGNTFNATEHDTEQRDYEELPNGDYLLEIEASDIVPTSTGSGTVLKTTIVVIAPEALKGRKLFNNYNLENANPQAQEIGQRQFASLCRAIGVDTVEDSEELHFRAFSAKIGRGKDSKEKNADGSPKYPARAEIKKYYFPDEGNVPEPAIDTNQPAAPVTRAQAPANDNRQAAGRPAPTAAAGGTRRPWGSK